MATEDDLHITLPHCQSNPANPLSQRQPCANPSLVHFQRDATPAPFFPNPRPMCQSQTNLPIKCQSWANPPIQVQCVVQTMLRIHYNFANPMPILGKSANPMSIQCQSYAKTEDKPVTNLGTSLLWGPTTGLVGGRIGQCHPSYL